MDALRAPASAEELADEERYTHLFDTLGPGRLWSPGQEQFEVAKPVRAIRIGSRAGAVAAAVLVASVSAAAAYTGAIPHRFPSSTHRSVSPQASTSTAPVRGTTATSLPSISASTRQGPTSLPTARPGGSALGPATPELKGAKGLCTAWSKGGLPTNSAAYQRLLDAAGGSGAISGYCASALSAAPGTHGAASHPAKPPKPPKSPKPPKPAKHAKPAKPAKPTKPPKGSAL
jgi:hypothetical protein